MFVFKLEMLFARIGAHANAVARFFYYFRVGRENRYPVCCITHYAVDAALRKHHAAVRRGVIFAGTERAHVPCGFHKKFHRQWSSYYGVTRKQLKLF